MSSTKPSIKKNYLYNLAYRILTLITPLITSPYISRVLGTENIGIYSFTNANASYFILFGVFGLSSYSQLECAKKRDNKTEFSQFCIESIITRFLLMGTSILIYSILFIFRSNKFSLYYTILILSLLANMLDFTWICEGLEEYRSITIRNFIVKFSSVVAIFVFVKNSNDLSKYFVIITLSIFLGNVIIIPYISRFISLKNISHISVAPHIKAALVFFLPSVASTIISTADKIMIGWFAEDMTQNGNYEQALKIESMIFMIFSSLYTTMRSRMAYLYKQENNSEAQEYIYKALSVILFLSLPICAGLFQISDIFVPWFFGPGYEGAIVLLKIMSGWLLIKSFSNCLLELSVLCSGNIIGMTKIIWIGAISNVILNGLFIPIIGARGAAIASLTTESIILLISLIYTRKKVLFAPIIRSIPSKVIAVSVMVVATFLCKGLMLFDTLKVLVVVTCGAFSYFLTVLILKDDVMIHLLRSIKVKIRK